MRYSRNPKTGILECYTDEGKYVGVMATMGDAPEKQEAKDEFREEEHPRDEDGKFSSGGGGSNPVESMKSSGNFHTVDLDGINEDNAVKINQTFDKLFSKFPMLKGKVGINMKCEDPDAYAECNYYGDGTIQLSAMDFSGTTLHDQYMKTVEEGTSPAGTDERAIVAHEFGHIIDAYLTRKYLTSFSRTAATTLRTKVLKELGLDKSSIEKEVCSYASTSAREWFAECIAEAFTSDKPRRMATECMRQVELMMAR